MPYRLTKIYTRAGDDGHTSLGKERIPKDHPLIEALGTLDELNCMVGLIMTSPIQHQEIIEALTQIQHELFDLGSELLLPERMVMTAERVIRLEKWLDQWNATLAPLEEFLLPRGNSQSVSCHLARTVARRAERCVVRLHRTQPLSNPQILRYINRLSDLLFVIARVLAQETAESEVLWDQER